MAICEVSTGTMMSRMMTTSGMRTAPPFLGPRRGFSRLSSKANERTAAATMSTGLTMTTLRPSPTSVLRPPQAARVVVYREVLIG